jgi:hypothetical protein
MHPRGQTIHARGNAGDLECTVGTRRICHSSHPRTSTGAHSGASPHWDGSSAQWACALPTHSTRPSIPSETRMSSKKGSSKVKKRRARSSPTWACKQTIDPLHWGSTHLSGIFLDGKENDDGGANGGETTEVEEHIIDVSDQTRTPPRDDKTPPPHAAGAEIDLEGETATLVPTPLPTAVGRPSKHSSVEDLAQIFAQIE